jgi:myo-inositol 2-dehydrogenase/D-chiro-inositol 1-dehydrogenase
MNPTFPHSLPTRRRFIQQSSLALAAAALPLSASRAADDITTKTIRLGLIGCGGRGSGAAAQALTADSNSVLVAMGDVFPEQIDKSLGVIGAQFKDKPGRVEVPKENQFVGLDAYEKVLASGVDLVCIAAPGGFRPLHLKASIEAGKHVFCEKPMGVDPAGVRMVMEAVKLAKQKNLAIRAGFSMRFEPGYREAIQRIRDGQIGDVLAIYSTRMGNPLTRFSGERKPAQTDLEWQLRNWHYFNWLSGDYIMEISVHSVDKIAWVYNDVPPVRCVGSGARQQMKIGDVWDQFDVTYEWADGRMAFLKTRYQDGCFNSHDDTIIGTKGRAVFVGYEAKILGEKPWRYQGPKLSSHQVEHTELFAELRAGVIPNDGDRMAQSTLMGVMGRMSAYTGKEVTWQKALTSQLDTFPKNLSWDMTLPVGEVPVAGRTPLV